MKAYIVAALFPLLSLSATAQQSETVTVNTINTETSRQNKVLYNPYFVQGKVVFKDDSYADAALNYNKLTGQILFISMNRDTLALSRPEATRYVVVGVDTFAFHETGFLMKVTHFATAPNLYVKQYMKFIGKEKKGPYGTYSNVAASNSNSTYTPDNQHTSYISIDENHVYKSTQEYYLSDATGNEFYPASKKGFYSAFPTQEKKLRDYLNAYRPDYNSEDDLMQVFKYIQKEKK